MLVWAPKTAEEVVFREINWSGLLDGDIIATSVLEIETGTIILSAVSNTVEIVSATVSGGAEGVLQILKNTITTGDGRTLVQVITMAVLEAQDEANPSLPSTASKQTIVQMAFEVAGLAGYTFAQTPEEQNSALRRLDGLMAQWQTEGIHINYNSPVAFGEGDLSDMSGIPDFAVVTASTALAMSIAPGIGKTMSAEAKAAFNQGMMQLRTATAVIPEMIPTRQTPRGSGGKPWSTWNPFFARSLPWPRSQS